MLDDVIVAELVEPLGGDAGHDMRRDEVEQLGGKAAGLAHALEIVRGMDFDAAGFAVRPNRRHAEIHEAISRLSSWVWQA